MESDMKSTYSTVGSCSDNGAELAYDYWFQLGLENSLTETLRENTRGRVYQAFPPPPPPPTRESSVSLGEGMNTPGDLKSAVSSRKGTIPYKLPDLKACTVLAAGTSFMRSSGIRETLPRIRKLQVRKQPHIPLADILLSSEITTDTTKQPLGFEKLSNDTERHEEEAARALLVLRQCSLKMAEMTKTWSHPSRVPLCDFIVAQKKCQVILEGIETLKDARVQVREATAVDDAHENNKLMRYAKEKQRYKDRHKSFSRTFSSRSSSIISVVNVITNEKGSGARSKSTSSERTTTKSPTESSRDMSHLTTPASTSIYEDPGRGSRSSLEDCKRIMGKIGKTSKSGKNRNTHMKCLQCSATDTPEWRKGPVGPTTLCNACGLFYKKLLKRFGGDTAGMIMRMRQNENPRDRKVPRSISS